MALCERCGSIQVLRARATLADKAIAFFTAKRPFVCGRCRWRGRRAWTDSDLAKLAELRSSGEVAADPSLVGLDDIPKEAVRPGEFELSTLDLTQPVTADEKIVAGRHGRPGKRRRQKRSRRREVFAAIALSALVLFAIILLGLTGSCVGGAANRSNTFLPIVLSRRRFTSASVISPRSPRNPTESSGRQLD